MRGPGSLCHLYQIFLRWRGESKSAAGLYFVVRCGHWSQVATAAATATQHHQQQWANSQSQGHIGVPTTHSSHVGSRSRSFHSLYTDYSYRGHCKGHFQARGYSHWSQSWLATMSWCHLSRVYTDSLFTLSVASLHVHPATAKTRLLRGLSALPGLDQLGPNQHHRATSPCPTPTSQWHAPRLLHNCSMHNSHHPRDNPINEHQD